MAPMSSSMRPLSAPLFLNSRFKEVISRSAAMKSASLVRVQVGVVVMLCVPFQGSPEARRLERRTESSPLPFRVSPWTYDNGRRT